VCEGRQLAYVQKRAGDHRLFHSVANKSGVTGPRTVDLSRILLSGLAQLNVCSDQEANLSFSDSSD
jgi:hypothetical protein